jgi:Holliday junction resolvase
MRITANTAVAGLMVKSIAPTVSGNELGNWRVMNSRAKGSAAEREIVAILKERGYDVHRTPLSGALEWMPGDITGLPYCIEVKRCEQVRLGDWVKQAKEQAKGGAWLLIHRKSYQEWMVTMPFEQWLREREG